VPDLLDTILYLVFPVDCAACGRPAAERRLPFFCRSCWDSIRPLEGPLCPRCGRPFDSPLALAFSPGHLCRPCRDKPPRYDRALAPYRYEGVLEQAIRLFKYRRRDALAIPLADLMLVWADRLPPADLVMPVPLHPSRLRTREFNQSLLLADRIAYRLGLPLSFESLARIRETRPQTELDRRDRARNVRRAFAVRDPEGLENRRVLLVDDVLTTGATVNDCARALRRAGAASVAVLTLARRV
jgi:ComF family protein